MRFPVLLMLLAAPGPLFSASQLYGSLKTPLIVSLNSTTGGQLVLGATDPNPETFFLAPDGKTFFVIGFQGTLEAVIPSTGQRRSYRTTYPVFTNFLSTTPFAFTPDAAKLLVGTCSQPYALACQQGYVEILDIASGKELAAIPFNSYEVTRIAVSPDGLTAYVTGYVPYVCPLCPSDSITAVSLTTFAAGNSLPLHAPGKIVLNPSGTIAYVAPAFGGGTLSMINLPQLTVAGQVIVTGGERLAISGDGSLLCATTSAYNASVSYDTLACYQAGSLAPAGSVQVPFLSDGGFAMDSKGEFAYLGNSMMNGTITKVDLHSMSVSASFLTGWPQVGLSASGRLYVLCGAGASVAAFKETSGLPSRVLSIPRPAQLLVSPDGLTLYAALYHTSVVAVSVLSGVFLQSYLNGYSVASTALTPDGRTLFAGAGKAGVYGSYYFFEVDTASGAIKNQIGSTSEPSVAVAPDGKTVLIGNLNGQTGVYDVASGQVQAAIPSAGIGVTINSAGTLAYAASSYRGTSIDRIDLTNYSVSSIDAGAFGIVFNPVAHIAYSWGEHAPIQTLFVIDTDTSAVILTAPLPNGEQPGLAVSNDGEFLYIAGTVGPNGPYSPGSVVDAKTMTVVAEQPTLGPLAVH